MAMNESQVTEKIDRRRDRDRSVYRQYCGSIMECTQCGLELTRGHLILFSPLHGGRVFCTGATPGNPRSCADAYAAAQGCTMKKLEIRVFRGKRVLPRRYQRLKQMLLARPGTRR